MSLHIWKGLHQNGLLVCNWFNCDQNDVGLYVDGTVVGLRVLMRLFSFIAVNQNPLHPLQTFSQS